MIKELNSLTLKIRYLFNDAYNHYYIKKMNIADNEPVLVDSFKNESEAKPDSSPFMTVWLLNIDRIMAASKVNPAEFHFLDVGCGKAISTIYARLKYKFISVSGFDFEPDLISVARVNARKADINLFEADATKILLDKKKHFIFMFNPFNAVVMDKFLENNLEMLKATNSVIGYANAREMDVFRSKSPRKIVDIPGYKCSVIFF